MFVHRICVCHEPTHVVNVIQRTSLLYSTVLRAAQRCTSGKCGCEPCASGQTVDERIIKIGEHTALDKPPPPSPSLEAAAMRGT